MASGDTLLVLLPQNGEPPSSNYATHDTRNLHPVLDFDASTNESIVFSAIMPQHFSGGGVSVLIHFSMSSATSGDVDWDASFERIGDQQQDIDSDSFDGIRSQNNITVPGTSGLVDIVDIGFAGPGTDMDGIAAGDGFRLKITRDATSDTAAGDAELRFVEIREG